MLEQHQILLVLSDKTLYSYPIEALDPEDSQAAAVKRGRKICHCNFFKAGICVGQQLVACVKTTSLSTTIKVFEPMENQTKKSKKSGIAKMLAGGQDALKPYKVKIPDFFDPIPQIFDKNQFSLDTARIHQEDSARHVILTYRSIRNSTSPPNLHRSIFCARNSALAALVALRWLASRPSRHNRCLIKRTHRSTLLHEKKISSQSISSVLQASSYYATLISPSSLIETDGGQGLTGRLPGRAIHRLLRFSTRISLRLSHLLSKSGIWRAACLCIF